MFKDMLNQKKNMLLSKLTSFDSDVSKIFLHIIACIATYPINCGQAYLSMIKIRGYVIK